MIEQVFKLCIMILTESNQYFQAPVQESNEASIESRDPIHSRNNRSSNVCGFITYISLIDFFQTNENNDGNTNDQTDYEVLKISNLKIKNARFQNKETDNERSGNETTSNLSANQMVCNKMQPYQLFFQFRESL